MIADAIFGGDGLEVIEQLLALAEIVRPGISRAEGIGIGMIRRIDAAAGIAVDIPGPAQLVVLLDDGVGDAEMAERDGKRDRADAAADDQHMVLFQHSVSRTLAPARLARDKSHL